MDAIAAKDADARIPWLPLGAGLTLLVLATCAVILRGFFQYDDFILLSQAKSGWSFQHPLTFFTISQNGLFTPLNNLLFFLEFRAFGLHPLGYVAFSVLLHLGNTFLVTLLAWQVTRDRASSAVAGILFAVGYAKMEAVTWIAAYVHAVTTLCYLASLNCLLRRLSGAHRGWYGLSLAFFVLGMFSKEPIASLPLMAAVAVLLFGSGSVRRRLGAAMPYFVLGAVYVVGMYFWQKYGPAALFLQTGIYRPGWREARNLAALGGLIVPPASSALLHFLARIPHLGTAYQALAGFCGLAFLPGLAWCFWRGTRAVRFSVLWIVVCFLPFVFVTTGIASRYLYLPSVGFCLLVGSLAPSWRENRLTPRWAGGAWLLAAYVAANLLLSFVWQRQQVQNGQMRRAVIRAVAAQAPWPPGSSLCVTGLSGKFEDIDMALPLWVSDAPRLYPAAKCPGGAGRMSRATFTGGRLVVDGSGG